MWAWLTLWTALLPVALCLIAYDCNTPGINTTIISRREIAPCPVGEDQYSSRKLKVQVLQRNEVKQQHVMSCLVEVTRLVTYCGMHSHASVVAGGLATYVHPLGREECQYLHHQKAITLYKHYINRIIMNGTTTADITLYGSLDSDGTCYGTSFSDSGRSWDNVVVQATIKITAMDYTASVRLETNEIVLTSGLICPYLKGYCMDTVYGETTWDSSNVAVCNELSELFRGTATVVTEIKIKTNYLVVEAAEKVFALELKQTIQQCGKDMWQTEHPRIIVLNTELHTPQLHTTPMFPRNVDMSAYINSKFLYVEQAYKRSLHQLYVDTIKRRCELKREILHNKLLMAPLSPTTIGSLIGETQGHIGRVLGEAIYLMRCVPRIVTVRRINKCYHELPITVNNQSKFMAPITRIIQDSAEEIDCTALTPPLYYLEGSWVGFTPDPIIRQKPISLTPEEEEKIEFTPIQPLGSGGIYTQQEVEKSQHMLKFDGERKAVENIIVRRISGGEADGQGYSPLRIFNADDLSSLAQTTFRQLWGWFTDIGIFTSGLMGIYLVFRLIKYVLGVALNGWHLYETVGCGLALFASLWNTLAVWVLHRHYKNSTAQSDVEQVDEQKTMVVTDVHPRLQLETETIHPSRQDTNGLYPAVPHWTDQVNNKP